MEFFFLVMKVVLFYYKIGLIWYEMRNFDLVSNCFEKVMDFIVKVEIDLIFDLGERKLLLDFNIVRLRIVWEVLE